MTALAGAVGSSTSMVPSATAATSEQASNGKFDFDTIYNRIGTDSVKFDQQMRNFGPGSVQVGMGIADMDFRAAPSITKALQKRLEHENWGYLDMGATTKQMSELVAAWNKKRYNLTVNPETIAFSTGVHPAIIATLEAFCPRGSKVLLTTPTYNGFYGDLRNSGTVPEESQMKVVNGRYSLDFEDFERRIGPDTNAFILCNPQNPTGNCWSATDLMKIGEICLKRRVVLLADEIHCDFVAKGQKYTPFASLPDKAIVNNSITFKAASKSFGLAAHKYAWYFSTNPEYMKRIAAQIRSDITTLGVVANRGALEGGEEWLNQCVDYIDGNHELVAKHIAANIPMIKCVKPEGTYLMWLDVTAVAEKIGAKAQADAANKAKAPNAPSITPEQIVERFFVKNAKVHLNQGASYGLGGANHMRMNLGTSRKMIETALTNMASALKNPSTSMLI